MDNQNTTAVIGAGVIGCAVAYALAREGHSVMLMDRAEPGMGGASFGNVGHLATELVQPLPSRQLLLNFWRELFALDGPLDIPARHLFAFAPWASRFARAAFRREANTRYLAPLVRSAAEAYERVCGELRRPDLIRRNGHYQVWFGPKAQQHSQEEAAEMSRLGVPTQPVSGDVLRAVAAAAGQSTVAGLWFPESGHVVDPLEVVQAFAQAAVSRGATIERTEVRSLRPRGERIEVLTESGSRTFDKAVICAGSWSAPLLAALGLNAPLESAFGYHVELQHQPAHVDAPLLYVDHKVLITPMTGRLRASSYMEFSGLDSQPDPRKPERLWDKLRALGYRHENSGSSWRGPRPVLPDYLPGIGRAPAAANVCYAIGHQHIGLTLAPVTAVLIADLMAGRKPQHDISAFDLRRF